MNLVRYSISQLFAEYKESIELGLHLLLKNWTLPCQPVEGIFEVDYALVFYGEGDAFPGTPKLMMEEGLMVNLEYTAFTENLIGMLAMISPSGRVGSII